MASPSPFLGILEAFRFATLAHEGQTRHGGEPYIGHPIAVATLLLENYSPATSDMVVAALLHDVVEDTFHTLEELGAIFGPTVYRLLVDLTDPEQVKGESGNQYFKRVRFRWPYFSWEAKVIKCADSLHNLQSLPESSWDDRTRARYAEKALEMLEAFNFKEPVKLAELVKSEATKWKG